MLVESMFWTSIFLHVHIYVPFMQIPPDAEIWGQAAAELEWTQPDSWLDGRSTGMANVIAWRPRHSRFCWLFHLHRKMCEVPSCCSRHGWQPINSPKDHWHSIVLIWSTECVGGTRIGGRMIAFWMFELFDSLFRYQPVGSCSNWNSHLPCQWEWVAGDTEDRTR